MTGEGRRFCTHTPRDLVATGHTPLATDRTSSGHSHRSGRSRVRRSGNELGHSCPKTRAQSRFIDA